MLIPVLNIKWVYMHSACFVRDIPPHEYAPGCIMLLLIIFALMAIGLLGMRVASVDGSSHFAARLYRTLTAMSFLFSLSSGVMFLGYAMPDFNAVSSTQEMLTVREWGYSQACVKEKMLNHAYVLQIVGRCCEIAVSLPLVFPRSCRLLLLVLCAMSASLPGGARHRSRTLCHRSRATRTDQFRHYLGSDGGGENN